MKDEMPKDMFGRSIQPGDWVAYPGRYGSTQYMRVMLVETAEEGRVGGYSYERCWRDPERWTRSKNKTGVSALERSIRISPCESLLKASS